MEKLAEVLSGMGLPETTTAEKALEVARVRVGAGDDSWVEALSDEASAELLKALETAETATKAETRKTAIRTAVQVRTGAERALADQQKAAEGAKNAADAALSRQMEPQFSERDKASAITEVSKKVDKFLAALGNPEAYKSETGFPLAKGEVIHRFGNPGIEEVAAYQEFCDTAYAISQLTARPGITPDVRNTNYWRRNADLFSDLKAMYSTGSNVGDEWVPTGWSSNLIEKVRIAAVLTSKHPHFVMPTNPYIYPLEYTDPTMYLQAEATSDTQANYTASTPGTNQKSWTAKVIASRSLISGEFIEDSIIPVIPQLQTQIVKAHAETMDNIMCNGQAATPSGLDTGNQPAADDVRAAWYGYRYYAAAVTDAAVSLSTFNADKVASIIGDMGKYGANTDDLMWVMTPKVRWTRLALLKDSSNNNVMMPFGGAADQGVTPNMFGIEVVVTGQISDSLSDSGIYDGSTTTHAILLLVYKPAFWIGDRRDMRTEQWKNISTGQITLVTTSRIACTNVFSAASNPTVGLGYDFLASGA